MSAEFTSASARQFRHDGAIMGTGASAGSIGRPLLRIMPRDHRFAWHSVP